LRDELFEGVHARFPVREITAGYGSISALIGAG
jgi:hypothetical protein